MNTKLMLTKCARFAREGHFLRVAILVLFISVLSTAVAAQDSADCEEFDIQCLNEATIAEASKVIAKNPKHAFAYMRRGLAYLRSEDTDDLDRKARLARALADLSKSIELNPTAASYYGCRAEYYEETGDNQRALADYAKGLEMAPRETDLYYKRAALYSKMRLYDQAIADYRTIQTISPNDVSAGRAIEQVNRKKAGL